jgi:glycosyltransferase involved in cell wall biosynthesis
MDAWGNDMIGAHWSQYRPDVTVLLIDIWVYAPSVLRSVPITAYAPIDHAPLPPAVEDKLNLCRNVWAMSRFGEREMRKAGLDPYYVPHGVNTQVYKPADRVKAREMCGVKQDQFFAIMVAANKGLVPRKSFDKVLKAWARFVETHPDALLHIHTQPKTGGNDDLNLLQMADFYGINEKNLRFPDEYRYLRGDYDPGRLNALYNAADVLLAPSMGEGFGVPVVGAQSAGCPVIVSDFSAQSELCFGGYKIPIDPFDDLVYTPMAAEMCTVRPSEIVKSLEWALEHRGDETLRRQARAGAMDYEAVTVFDKFMLPSMEAIASRDADIVGRRKPETVTPAPEIVKQNGHALVNEPALQGVRLG